MSAVLDTVRSFSSTLAVELAEAVKAQDQATIETLDNIAHSLDGAMQSLETAQRMAEETFRRGLDDLVAQREVHLLNAREGFGQHIIEIRGRIEEMRGFLRDTADGDEE
jgi:hypothetical protein